MKENILGPRQWAFVVITGGAACALPFLQIDNAPTATDNASTTSQHDPSLTTRYTLADSDTPGGALVAPSSVREIVPPLPPSRLPEWANANRSPFDELVGNTASKPEAAHPDDQLPMQPLRPWITGPGDNASLATNTSSTRGTVSTAPSAGMVAHDTPSAVTGSPWSDEAVAFKPIDQLAGGSSGVDPNHGNAQRDGGAELEGRWPDQAVSAEELAQATRSREQELASAIVAASRAAPSSPSSPLLAAPPLPTTTPSPTISTVPVAAARFGQAYMPPDPASQRSASVRAAPNANSLQGEQLTSSPSQFTSSSALPALPESRKPHIIFQPSLRK